MGNKFQFTIRQLLIATALIAMTMWLIVTCRAGEVTEDKQAAMLFGIPTLVSSTTGVFVGKPLRWALFGMSLGFLIALVWFFNDARE